jgi:hypothetical protein
MQSEGQSTKQDSLQESSEVETLNCPNCKDAVPATLYCLKCGYPLFDLLGKQEDVDKDQVETDNFFDLDPLKNIKDEASLVPEEASGPSEALFDENRMRSGIDLVLEMDETVELAGLIESVSERILGEEDSELEDENIELSRPEDMIEDEGEIALEDEPVMSAYEPGSHSEEGEESSEDSVVEEDEMDPGISDLTKELMNSISLQLWSVNLLQEGGVDEDHFNRIFKGYRARFESCMAQREKMLEEARCVEPFEKKVNEAKVQLGELEVRRSLGDLNEGEYEAMAPALRWTIEHYEEQITKRNDEIALITDLANWMPADQVADMRETVDTTREAMEGIEGKGMLGSETVSRIKASLEEILALLEGR